ncbi:MAG: nitrilase-related carbon-nitrogen hydrolase [Butyrivibrio sp.]
MTDNQIKVGICQTDIIFENKVQNLIRAEQFIKECACKGADIVLFPEMSMTGFSMNPQRIYETMDNNAVMERMSEYAVDYNTAVGFGYVLKDDGYTNRYRIVDKDGSILCDYAKIHPFSYAGEDKVYRKGDKLDYGRIGAFELCPLICYDLRFPELFLAAADKADVIIVPANWGGARNSQWRILLQARALENQCYVIGVNRVGNDPSTYYVGNSIVADPYGNIMEDLGDKENSAVVTLDINTLKNFRREFPVRRDRRKEIYGSL